MPSDGCNGTLGVVWCAARRECVTPALVDQLDCGFPPPLSPSPSPPPPPPPPPPLSPSPSPPPVVSPPSPSPPLPPLAPYEHAPPYAPCADTEATLSAGLLRGGTTIIIRELPCGVRTGACRSPSSTYPSHAPCVGPPDGHPPRAPLPLPSPGLPSSLPPHASCTAVAPAGSLLHLNRGGPNAELITVRTVRAMPWWRAMQPPDWRSSAAPSPFAAPPVELVLSAAVLADHAHGEEIRLVMLEPEGTHAHIALAEPLKNASSSCAAGRAPLSAVVSP